MKNGTPAEKKTAVLGRRGVLTAAAWSAPVIALAVAAPMAAASGNSVSLTFSNPRTVRSNGRITSISATVTIVVTGATLTNVKLSINVTPGNGLTNVSTNDPTWNFANGSISGNTATVVINRTGNLAAGTYSFTVTAPVGSGATFGKTATGVVTSTGAAPSNSSSVTWAA